MSATHAMQPALEPVMKKLATRRSARLLCRALPFAALMLAQSAFAQKDLSGMWGQRFHEDLPERGGGPDLRQLHYAQDHLPYR